jgi:hypothetical protein
MKRLVLIAATIGGVIPLVIFVALAAFHVTDALPDTLILWVWPTYFFLLGYAGPITWFTCVAVLISALANAALYALVVFVACLILRAARPDPAPPNREQPGTDHG